MYLMLVSETDTNQTIAVISQIKRATIITTVEIVSMEALSTKQNLFNVSDIISIFSEAEMTLSASFVAPLTASTCSFGEELQLLEFSALSALKTDFWTVYSNLSLGPKRGVSLENTSLDCHELALLIGFLDLLILDSLIVAKILKAM